jgi:hypothetical protein
MMFPIRGNVRIQVVRHDGENILDRGVPRGSGNYVVIKNDGK